MFEQTFKLTWTESELGGEMVLILLEDVCISGYRTGSFLGAEYVGCTEKFQCVQRLWIALKAKLGSLCMLTFA